jgi:hypothetical protein
MTPEAERTNRARVLAELAPSVHACEGTGSLTAHRGVCYRFGTVDARNFLRYGLVRQHIIPIY